jgi:MFS family permease
MPRRLRSWLADALVREALFAASLAGVLAALFAWLGPPGNDLAAHIYLRWEFLEHGLAFWSNLWYSGRYNYVTYSPLYYPLAGLIGIRLLATISIAAAAFAFSIVVGRQWGPQARWSSRSFAVLWAGIVFSAAFPFVLGGMLALFAIWALQSHAPRWRFALLSVLTMIASPLAFVFLVVVTAALGLAGSKDIAWRRDFSRLRAPALALITCVLIGLVTWRMFPSSGRYPFNSRALIEIGIFCALGAALTWRVERARLLRWIFPVYLAASLVVFLVPSELGANVNRLRLVALPLLLLAFSLREYRPRLFVAPVLALALFWNLGPIAEGFNHGRIDPSAEQGYWNPAIAFLHENLTPSYRVEVVDTVNHWAAAYLPRAGIPITRGWFRQDDYPQNEVLYNDPSRRAYLAWLRNLGVRYVILTQAPTDFSSRDEAVLIRSGRSGLLPVFRAPNLTVYEVPNARPIITGPGRARVLSLTETKIELQLGKRGRYRLAVHFSPYSKSGGACLEKTVDNMTELVAQRPGRVRLDFDVRAGRALAVLAGGQTDSCSKG